MFMVLSWWPYSVAISRVHPIHLMNSDSAPSGRQPSDQSNDLRCESADRMLSSTLPSPFIIITKPEMFYSFTVRRMAKGSKGVHSVALQPVPKAAYRSGCHERNS